MIFIPKITFSKAKKIKETKQTYFDYNVKIKQCKKQIKETKQTLIDDYVKGDKENH